jgi:hypothetical protein
LDPKTRGKKEQSRGKKKRHNREGEGEKINELFVPLFLLKETEEIKKGNEQREGDYTEERANFGQLPYLHHHLLPDQC